MRSRLVLVSVLSFTVLLASGCFLGVTSYRDSNDNSLVYVGLVYNGGEPMPAPYVEGTFYDAAGNIITTQEGVVCRVLPSKSAAPFRVVLPPDTPQPARVEWKLLGERGTDAYLASGVTARIVRSQPNIVGEAFYGELKNESSNSYRGAHVCAAWLNANGDVLRVEATESVYLGFEPGQVSPFALTSDPPADAVEIQLYPDAGVHVPGRPAPPPVLTIPTSAFEKSQTYGGPLPGGGGSFWGTLGEIHNDRNKPILPELSAILRDGSGGLISASGGGVFCEVSAPAGGFTYGTWQLAVPGTTQPSPVVRIEAYEFDASIRPALSASGVTHSPVAAGERVSGTIENSSGRSLDVINICVGAYAANGDLIGAFPAYPTNPGPYAANADVSFTVDMPTFGDTDEVNVIADGF